MSPIPPRLSLLHASIKSGARTSFAAVRAQWQNPTDILTVLMIIGGDVVQCALAQLVGSCMITPVAFSFGWVAYSFSAILSAVGTGNVMPEPDMDVSCINVKTGYDRDVKSWVLARLYRDLIPPPLKIPPKGLTLLFYETLTQSATGVRNADWVVFLGLFVIVFQLGIACIPGALQGNWVILIITIGGTLLAQVSAALPQWQEEMWRARDLITQSKRDKIASEVVCLTAGNGSSHVVVIKSVGHGLKLEDLAAGRIVPSRLTAAMTFALAFLWIAHLMTVQSVENDGWYLLAIGGVGMLQNVISAGVRRRADALGFHLKCYKIHKDEKVFKALQGAEDIEPHVGLALLDTFFPGGLREEEEKWREDKKKEKKGGEQEKRRQEGGENTAVSIQPVSAVHPGASTHS
ncbi:uncharacterized protein PHACADRAFT_184478 [Phanerochaete carnosa HHB-10118-sp]|uniref:Uncharacterized protein n=1 Tax=Phanerochaete carnosa (strain HHB-10118-sp) TaxID=650164 RepID=K5VVX1_PHACS|nr:uncharacterized protein PHACADRAFT_184478 [Phanerochaete carnosa HHB-10118-sp]EKM55703.1 hypothetical protein PHACADRAFT_184478 [Phanerochaete carnosa HHB-10118-sp]